MADDDDMGNVGIGQPTAGIPMPRSDGFIGRLRRTLERLEVSMTCDLLNVSFDQEKYIRSRMPQVQRDMDCKFSIRVMTNKRNRTGKRTLRIWRIE